MAQRQSKKRKYITFRPSCLTETREGGEVIRKAVRAEIVYINKAHRWVMVQWQCRGGILRECLPFMVTGAGKVKILSSKVLQK